MEDGMTDRTQGSSISKACHLGPGPGLLLRSQLPGHGSQPCRRSRGSLEQRGQRSGASGNTKGELRGRFKVDLSHFTLAKPDGPQHGFRSMSLWITWSSMWSRHVRLHKLGFNMIQPNFACAFQGHFLRGWLTHDVVDHCRLTGRFHDEMILEFHSTKELLLGDAKPENMSCAYPAQVPSGNGLLLKNMVIY